MSCCIVVEKCQFGTSLGMSTSNHKCVSVHIKNRMEMGPPSDGPATTDEKYSSPMTTLCACVKNERSAIHCILGNWPEQSELIAILKGKPDVSTFILFWEKSCTTSSWLKNNANLRLFFSIGYSDPISFLTVCIHVSLYDISTIL